MAQNHKSIINIAPFVDVLLVLFVILVVAARFDNAGMQEVKALNAEVVELTNKLAVASLVSVPSKETKVVTVIKTVEPKVVEKTKTIIQIDAATAGALADAKEENAKLREQLKSIPRPTSFKSSNSAGAINIQFTSTEITMNGVSVTENFIKTFFTIGGISKIHLESTSNPSAINKMHQMAVWIESNTNIHLVEEER